MNIRELRIGNYINGIIGDDSELVLCSVTGYDPKDEFLFVTNDNNIHYAEFVDFEPIPLTEERFKSLNPKFQYLRDFSAIYDLQGITIEFSGYGLPNPKFFISGIEIKSIHQLQNLYFALTGEELKLK